MPKGDVGGIGPLPGDRSGPGYTFVRRLIHDYSNRTSLGHVLTTHNTFTKLDRLIGA